MIATQKESQEMLSTITDILSTLLILIAAGSLFVGGIGIMNIMLASVAERTREIGLRKAVGARNKDILFQFLLEAVVLTVSGALLGILLGIGLSFLSAVLIRASNLPEWPFTVSVSSLFLATAISGGVGIIFGLWPAKKASKLSPIEALRYE